jgi:molybdopterin synthase sulfur carrier subunit
MRVVYCGRLQDAAGLRWTEVAPPPEVATTHALRDWLTREDPGLRSALLDPSVRIVVNDEVVPGDRPLAPGDEIAFMPPVSGG